MILNHPKGNKYHIHTILITLYHINMYNYYVSMKNNTYVYLYIYIFKNDFRVEKYDNWTENLLSLLTADTEERM